ncbi:hypothetical protein H072_9794 [Dactylellina haptotyla CBS 200.50]|uniref:Uncharacterized protein n=1 Tax=Dactylellina haptotyla (strain CBS 200.50) TaxID=1284197 RepID=S8A684_DACHA|nr:hypothetical protein H072_9794 [Dactylellina haptotyla CBS 200.50]
MNSAESPQPVPMAPYIINIVPQDSATTTSDITAWLALIFAGVAFIAALLQATLQYLTSSQRDKCLRGAIGNWSSFTKTGWDFSRWRIRMHYPQVNFELDDFLKTRTKSRSSKLGDWLARNAKGHFLMTRFELEKKNRLLLNDSRWWVGDRSSIAVSGSNQLLHVRDLSFSQKISWIWFCLTNDRGHRTIFAKAGWSNIFTVLEIPPNEGLITEYEDADIIPSTVDVPVQRIKLSDLSLLCYMVGLKNVVIDTVKGSIEAQNSFIKITTQLIPGLGQAVTIDGDFSSLLFELRDTQTSCIADLCIIARGELLGGRARADIGYLPESILLYSNLQNWKSNVWANYHHFLELSNFGATDQDYLDNHEFLDRSSLRHQAAYYVETSRNTQKRWSEIWKDFDNTCTPMIIKYLATMPFNFLISAAPLKLFYEPYFSYVEENRKTWYHHLKNTKSLNIQRHLDIDVCLVRGDIACLYEDSDFQLMVCSFTQNGSWMACPCITNFQRWKSEVAGSIRETAEKSIIYLPTVTISLLEGNSVNKVRQLMKDDYFLGKNYTLESAVILSLMIVDCQLQALWCRLENTGRLATFYSKITGTFTKLSDIQGFYELAQILYPELDFDNGSEPMMVHFVAFWFELGRRKDILGPSSSLESCVDDILNEWKDVGDPCIPDILPPDWSQISKNAANRRELSDEDKKKYFGKPPKSLTKREFVEWALSATEDGGAIMRIDFIRKMIPLLQLRTFLMDIYYRFHADSSDTYLAKDSATVNVRLI